MKFKKLLILTAIVSLLAVLAMVKNIAKEKRLAQEELASAKPFALIEDISTGFIRKITIYKGDDENTRIILAKDDAGAWLIENKFKAKAKKENIENLFKDLSGLKGELRAESKSVFGDFHLEDNQGVHIILEAEGGKTLAHIIASLERPGWDSCFIRLKDSDKIILFQKDLPGKVNIYNKDAKLDSNYFTDFKLFSFDTKKIETIKTSQKGKPFYALLKKKESDNQYKWDFEPAQKRTKIDSSKVDSFLQNASNIFAQDVLDPGLGDYGFEQDDFSLSLETDEKKTLTLAVGKYLEKEKAYCVKIMPENQVFKISEQAVKNIRKDKNHFLKEKTPVKK